MDLLYLFLHLQDVNTPLLILFLNVLVIFVNVIYLIHFLLNLSQNYALIRCTVTFLVIPAFFLIVLNAISGPDTVYLSLVCGEMNK